MGFRFRKSVKIAPGIRLNFGKKSASVSLGGKGARFTINNKGKKTASFGIPGTGIYYTESVGGKNKRKEKSNMAAPKTYEVTPTRKEPSQKPFFKKWWCWIIAVGILFSVVAGGGSDTIEDTPPQLQEEVAVSVPNDNAIPETSDIEPEIEEGPVVEEKPEVSESVSSEESAVPEPVIEATDLPVEEPVIESPPLTSNEKGSNATESNVPQESNTTSSETNVVTPSTEASTSSGSSSSSSGTSSSSGASVTVPPHSESEGNLVWVPTNGGSKYHNRAGCSQMKDPIQVSIETAKANGYTACGRCY